VELGITSEVGVAQARGLETGAAGGPRPRGVRSQDAADATGTPVRTPEIDATAPPAPAPPTRALDRTIRILSAGAKGGPGKTFLCKNLAACAAQEGFNVAIVDFDNQRTVTRWLSRRGAKSSKMPRIAGYTADKGSLADAHEVLGIVSHDLLFFDTAALDENSNVLKTLACGADLVLVPSAVGISDTEQAEILLRVLGEWQRPAIAILNRVKRNATKVIGLAKMRLVRAGELCPIEIAEYYDFLAADEIGLGATEMQNCVGKDDITSLWSAVKRRSGIAEA